MEDHHAYTFSDIIRLKLNSNPKYFNGCTIFVPPDHAFLDEYTDTWEEECWGTHIIKGPYHMQDLYILGNCGPGTMLCANMAFSLRMRGLAKSVISEKVAIAAEVLGLTPYLDRYPRALSGGQRQRVAMGRAIVRDPQVFLFDEPLSNLDAKLRVQMRAEIRELHQRLKSTTIYVTHDQIEAMTMADKIVVMQNGYIEQVGTPLDLYDRPANTFVAGFIGSPSMNLISATVTSKAGGLSALTEAGRLDLPKDYALSEGQKIIVGARPEVLMPADEGLKVTVSVVEPTGAETHLVTRSEGQEFTSVLRDRTDFSIGQQIHLSPTKASLHVFDAESTQRLEKA